MKKKILFILVLTLFLNYAQTQTLLSFDIYLGDTVNRLLTGNIKTGRWVFFGKDKKGKKYKLYKGNQIVEDGIFLNNQKNGLWRSYHYTGKLQSEIVYKDGLPNGSAKIYNEDGKITAEGFLTPEGFKGKYILYDEFGNKIEKNSDNKSHEATVRFFGIVLLNGKKTEGVNVTVELSGVPLFTIKTDSDGRFDLFLDLHEIYTIRFEKENFNEETIEINANTYIANDKNFYEIKEWTIRLTDNLVNTVSTEFLHLLLNKPSNRIYFNKRKKKFVSDGSYINVFTKQFRGLNNTTKMLLAQAADDNKRLEIENLRIEAEKKEAEIRALMKEQELKEAELKKKEAEIMFEKLEREKKEKDLELAEQDRKIKELELQKRQMEIQKKQLEAAQKEKELQQMEVLRKIQEYELKEKQKSLAESYENLREHKKEAERKAKELELAKKEKEIRDKELKQNLVYLYIALAGMALITFFSVFVYRSLQQKKKSNALLAMQAEEIKHQNKLIEEKNKETQQSIHYAKRIQFAILPLEKEIREFIHDYFVLYIPKDIVSGDFYFYYDKFAERRKCYIASVDCTGHGVPGAFMSLIGNEKLRDAIDVCKGPGKILSELNRYVKSVLKQSADADSTRDGMDVALLEFDLDENGNWNSFLYSGAHRPLWIIRKGSNSLEEIKATKVSIGGHTPNDQVFQEHLVHLNSGDTIYIFSDGYADQFGGERKKKMMTGKFKEILLSIQHLSIPDQKIWLENFFNEWKGSLEQMDDVLVIGIRKT
ncbi:MAG: SpoIIE family protein phosphatase [Bacteroidia bacterium]|nr:SpoIIE family protein phosphatase [Bacteroidia bacterium]